MGFEAWLCRADKSLGIRCTSQSAADMVRGLGSRALVSAQGRESADPGRNIMGWAQPGTSDEAQASTLLRSLYFTSHLLQHSHVLLSILLLWVLSEMKGLSQSAWTWPGLALLSSPWMCCSVHTRGSIKASSGSRAAPAFPWMSAGTDGTACAVNSFPLQEVSPRCCGGAALCSRQKAGVGPASWRQGGRKP